MTSDQIKPFTTDGCSGGMSIFWRKVLGHPPPWEGACVEHDKAYWMGGDKSLRKEADKKLADAVILSGYPMIATFMYFGVRLGGMHIWPFAWRWGYGWKWLHTNASKTIQKGVNK